MDGICLVDESARSPPRMPEPNLLATAVIDVLPCQGGGEIYKDSRRTQSTQTTTNDVCECKAALKWDSLGTGQAVVWMRLYPCCLRHASCAVLSSLASAASIDARVSAWPQAVRGGVKASATCPALRLRTRHPQSNGGAATCASAQRYQWPMPSATTDEYEECATRTWEVCACCPAGLNCDLSRSLRASRQECEPRSYRECQPRRRQRRGGGRNDERPC